MRNSSPVKKIATRTRRSTASVTHPTDAARPSACGVMRVPAGRITESRRISAPCRVIYSPGAGGCANETPASPAALAISCMTTVSAPGGTVAPVKKDARGRAFGERFGCVTRRNALQHRQDDGRVFARVGEIGGADRVAVHRTGVHRRDVKRRHDGFGEHAVRGVERIDAFVLGHTASSRMPSASAVASIGGREVAAGVDGLSGFVRDARRMRDKSKQTL